ncbi:hypothetical protein ACQ4PT_065585 [Festuca glaucescens]
MSFYLLQDGIHDVFDKVRSLFYWAKDKDKQKYHMVKWSTMCFPKELGGRSFTNTKVMNWCLMAKWAWKIFNGEGGLWQDIMRKKYRGNMELAAVRSNHGSHLWKTILKCRQFIRIGSRHSAGNGLKTAFWLDRWIHAEPLASQFPALFAICDNPKILVANVFNSTHRRPIFRHSFGPTETRQWLELDALLHQVSLSAAHDKLSWRLVPSGAFSTAPLYKALHEGASVFCFNELWKVKIPLKIKHFIWQLSINRLPSGDQVQKRHGPGDGLCPLCRLPEDQNHILFDCSLAKLLWAAFREVLGCSWAPSSSA